MRLSKHLYLLTTVAIIFTGCEQDETVTGGAMAGGTPVTGGQVGLNVGAGQVASVGGTRSSTVDSPTAGTPVAMGSGGTVVAGRASSDTTPSQAGAGPASGGTDAASGGTDAASGGTDVASGGTDAASGGTDAASGGTDAASGGTDAASGGT
ncbi:MAG: hypothetical protein VX589_12860, partial [Myxococcota bacterium]|nr:hypothetical protein [Myxococcota bacterium]